MQSDKQSSEYFRELETKLHKKEVRNSPALVSELLADEFMEFGSSGRIYYKPDTIKSLKNQKIDLQITIENFQVKNLALDLVLVTYQSLKLNPEIGKRVPALRSSIWKLIDGKWRMLFHQGTPTKA